MGVNFFENLELRNHSRRTRAHLVKLVEPCALNPNVITTRIVGILSWVEYCLRTHCFSGNISVSYDVDFKRTGGAQRTPSISNKINYT